MLSGRQVKVSVHCAELTQDSESKQLKARTNLRKQSATTAKASGTVVRNELRDITMLTSTDWRHQVTEEFRISVYKYLARRRTVRQHGKSGGLLYGKNYARALMSAQ